MMKEKVFHRKNMIKLLAFLGLAFLIMAISVFIIGFSNPSNTYFLIASVLVVISIVLFVMCFFESKKSIILKDNSIIFINYTSKEHRKHIKRLEILFASVKYVQFRESVTYLYNFESKCLVFRLKNNEEIEFDLSYYGSNNEQYIVDYLIKNINVFPEGD